MASRRPGRRFAGECGYGIIGGFHVDVEEDSHPPCSYIDTKVWAAYYVALSFLPFCSSMELGQLIHESQPWPFPQELSTSGASLALNLEGSTIEGIFRGGRSDLSFK